MANTATARNIVGIIGNVISFGLCFSPVPTFYGIIKKAVEELKPDPYLAIVLNCAFWMFYEMPFVHPNSILVITINSKKVFLWLWAEAIFFVAIVLTTMLSLHGTIKRSLVVGVLYDVFNVMMYAAPLTVMTKVIKTKSVKFMPFLLSDDNASGPKNEVQLSAVVASANG